MRWLQPQMIAAVVLGAASTLLVASCEYDAIPADPRKEYSIETDVGAADTVAQFCDPGAVRCQGPRVVQCRDDGSGFELERVCPSSTTCSNGVCTLVATHCDDRQGEEAPAFATSKTDIIFETDDGLATQYASLEVENCSDSDIWLQRAEIRDPSPVRGRSVFALKDASTHQEVRIPPSGVEVLRVQYEPRYAFSREPGQLRLQIIADAYREFDLPLVPRNHCVSATPSVDLGIVNQKKTGSVHVHNCGNQPVIIDGLEVVPNKPGEADQIQLEAALPSETVELTAGESVEIPYEATPELLGSFDHRIVYEIRDAERYTQERLATLFEGRVARSGCRSQDLPAPLVTQSETTHQSWKVEATLGKPVEVSMRLPEGENFNPDDPQIPAFRFEPPDGSRAEYEPGNETFPTFGKNRFTPDVPGTYRILLNYVDSSGRPLCEWQAVEIEAVPAAELYTDLSWQTDEDVIPDDVGFGRGIDLNLHVVPVASGDHVDWAEPRADCFGYGEYPAAGAGIDHELAECSMLGGEIRSVSTSGAHREIVAFPEATHDRYYVAIHAWSVADFDRARATVRLYAGGDAVDSFEVEAHAWEHLERPDDLGELLSREVSSPNRVLILGYWDVERDAFVVAPPTRFSGFPRSF